MANCGMWVSKEIKSIWSIVSIVSEKADGLSTMNYSVRKEGTDGDFGEEKRDRHGQKREQEIMQKGREAVAHEGSGVDLPAYDPGLQLAPRPWVSYMESE